MEKLQMALQKARAQRGGDNTMLQGTRRVRTPGAMAVDQLWGDLPEFEPETKTLLRNRVVTFRPGHEATTLDALRTKTLLHMRKNGWRRLAITSVTPSCGKTTMLCNIAIGMTRQPDVRTLLFDLDLRRPSIARMLGAKPAHDVTEMLAGEVSFEAQALRIRSNLAVSLATRTAADPMRCLMSNDTRDQLQEIERRYKPELMLFDLPPLIVGGDTPGFLSNVDCALIVARCEKTTVSELDKCEQEIAEHTNVMGVVLNQYRYSDETVGYYDYGS